MGTGDVDAVLVATSRTFSVPILELPPRLREAITASYLCTRAIDEIEDHPTLDRETKLELLRQISRWFQIGSGDPAFLPLFRRHAAVLPEVALRIQEWAAVAPPDIAPRVMDTVAAMADRMADWVECGWDIQTETDLDRYAFATAGVLGLLLSDLWAWYDGTTTDRPDAVAFGRGLQAVNMLLGRSEDLARGVDFFPSDWDATDLEKYAIRNLRRADRYLETLPAGPAQKFCRAPLALAWGSLEALKRGERRLSRKAARDILHGTAAEPPLSEHQ